MKTVEVCLGYYKQGDDLHSCVQKVGNSARAFDELHCRLTSVLNHLDELFQCLMYEKIEIEADTHYIGITCEDEIAQKLVDEDLAYFPEYEDADPSQRQKLRDALYGKGRNENQKQA